MAATLQGSSESQTVVMLNDVQENGQVKGAWSVWGWGGVGWLSVSFSSL